MANVIATAPATGLQQVPELARKVHSMNAKMFVHAAAMVNRLVDVETALVEMVDRARTNGQKAEGVIDSLWKTREDALTDILALIRATL